MSTTKAWDPEVMSTSEVDMRRSDLVRNAPRGKSPRTSQIVFGERQHLLRVLDSVERSALPASRLDQ